MSNIMVKKFGGTSLGSLERIKKVALRVCNDAKKGQSPIVVASAMSGETNRLVELAHKIYPHYRGQAYDLLVSSGEQVSISLLAMAIEKLGYKAKPLLAYQLGIETDSFHSKARILKVKKEKLNLLCSQGIIPVVAGFQGIDKESNVTTLGRGGSDTTAVALAAAIGAAECEIYTDVPAVCTGDPRIIKKVRDIDYLSYEEMMEMAALGSKVLHSRSVELACKYKIKIHLRSTFEDRIGTYIVNEGEIMEKPLVSAVTHDAQTAVFELYPTPKGASFLSELFAKLSENGVIVDIITQSRDEKGQKIAFSINKEDIGKTRETLGNLPKSINIICHENKAKVSVVGVGMRNHYGVAANFFNVFAKNNVEVHLVTTSEIKISAIVDIDNLDTIANALHTVFDLDKKMEL